MMKISRLFLHAALPLLLFTAHGAKADTVTTDVAVIGGGTSGTTAAIQAARSGTRVVVVEPTAWLGGMLTMAGVGAVDGNYRLPAGLWGEFRDSLAVHYGGLEALKTGWVSNVMFEPSVGNRIFHRMVERERLVTLWHQSEAVGVERAAKGLWQVAVKRPSGAVDTLRSRVLIDATELGDIARMVGVPYDVGMESRAATHEDIAPDEANSIVQDLTYVAILKDYGRDVTIPRPEGYNPNDFACCCVNAHCVTPKEPNRMWSKDMMITYGRMPGGKYMINWPIEGNDFYANMVDMSPSERDEAVSRAKHFTLCFVYFLQHELGYSHLGLADDEFPTPDRLPFIPYHRESRRIHGLVRFTLNHMTDPFAQPQPLYRTGIAVGDYPVDHHHTRYTGREALPDLHFHPVPSFSLPLGALLPQGTRGLVVAEKSVSVSNIANGSTRLQPVVMQIGQAAGALAALAVKRGCDVADVPVREVQGALLAAGGYLLPYADVPKDSALFLPCQRVGATGILRGRGVSIDWHNQTLFRPDTIALRSDLAGLVDLYPSAPQLMAAVAGKGSKLSSASGQPTDVSSSSAFDAQPLTVADGTALIAALAKAGHVMKPSRARRTMEALAATFGFSLADGSRALKRGEVAVLIDGVLHPFESRQVDIEGRFVK